MIVAQKTIGNISVSFEAERKAEYYLNESGDIKQLDEDYLLYTIHNLKQAQKKGSFVYKLKPIGKEKRNALIKADNQWIEKNSKPIKSGGIFTMLSNKGII
jgi:hypothetical protein